VASSSIACGWDETETEYSAGVMPFMWLARQAQLHLDRDHHSQQTHRDLPQPRTFEISPSI
jgi:hypothetical protein